MNLLECFWSKSSIRLPPANLQHRVLDTILLENDQFSLKGLSCQIEVIRKFPTRAVATQRNQKIGYSEFTSSFLTSVASSFLQIGIGALSLSALSSPGMRARLVSSFSDFKQHRKNPKTEGRIQRKCDGHTDTL